MKKYISTALIGAAAAGSLAIAGLIAIPVSAQTVNATVGAAVSGSVNGRSPGQPGAPGGWNGHRAVGSRGGIMGMKPAVFGTVSAVNGTTLTVSGKTGFSSTTPTSVYMVNASGATVKKNNATSSVSDITVGDTVMVQGTVSGTSVTATAIRDGAMPMMQNGRGGFGGPGMNRGEGSTTRTMPVSPITGNGQPIIAGTVSAINGASLTVTNKSNVTYTVDTTNAKIVQGQTTVSVGSLAVGEYVIVQGSVSGSSVSASSVIDQKAGQAGAPGNAGPNGTAPAPHPGIFGSIGQFFSRIFGF